MKYIVLWILIIATIAGSAVVISHVSKKNFMNYVLNEATITLYRTVRRSIVFLVGSTVLLIGVIMFVTPGPAFVVIPLGLAILGTEFLWARRLLLRVKNYITEMAQKAAGKGGPTNEKSPPTE